MAKAQSLARYGLFVERGFLDGASCRVLRARARASPRRPATVVTRGVNHLDPELRRANCVDVGARALRPVQDRLRHAVPRLERHFGVTLAAPQPLQLVVYREGDFFRPHSDSDSHPESSERLRDRKVSVVLFLNGPSRGPADDGFGGGALAFYRLVDPPTWENCRIPLDGEAGLLVAFRSAVFHEVAPVTHGERFTIVTWYV